MDKECCRWTEMGTWGQDGWLSRGGSAVLSKGRMEKGVEVPHQWEQRGLCNGRLGISESCAGDSLSFAEVFVKGLYYFNQIVAQTVRKLCQGSARGVRALCVLDFGTMCG